MSYYPMVNAFVDAYVRILTCYGSVDELVAANLINRLHVTDENEKHPGARLLREGKIQMCINWKYVLHSGLNKILKKEAAIEYFKGMMPMSEILSAFEVEN